jgi:hypothetical protein
MHKAFQIPQVMIKITKSCKQQVEVIQNHENENVREARHRKYVYKKLKLGGGHVYDCSSV